jgi:hypothetical protein
VDDKVKFTEVLSATLLTVDDTICGYEEVEKFENIDEDTPVAVEIISELLDVGEAVEGLGRADLLECNRDEEGAADKGV